MHHWRRLIGIAAGLALLATDARAWQQTLTGTGFTPADSIESQDDPVVVTVDASANLIVAGAASNAGGGYDFVVVKLAALTGAEVWPQRYVLNGTATGSKDSARAVVVDGNGDVVVAGKTQNTGTGDDFTVVKLSGTDGHALWGPVVVGSSRVDLQACKLEYSIVSPK